MQIALQGLYTNDPQLRGTAMEYLESVLPPKILSRLWPVLAPPLGSSKKCRTKNGSPRRTADVPDFNSNQSREPATEAVTS